MLLPSAFVVALVGETVMRFRPDLFIIAVTVSPSTGQPPLPVTVTTTSPLSYTLRVSLPGNAAIDSGSHVVVQAMHWRLRPYCPV